ncbi:MAG: hypothetical protein K2P12_00140 [Clostridia bacterium]|nr:hypothetical protein [Clostridia bacterium]
MKKKIAFLVMATMIILTVCLTGCNSTFKFADMGLSKDNVTNINFVYIEDYEETKETSQPAKIEKVLKTFNSLSFEKCKDKVYENVFKDSIIAQIRFKVADTKGEMLMTFVETTLNDKKVCLFKCEGLDGFKIKKMPKDIYIMSDSTILRNIFRNDM